MLRRWRTWGAAILLVSANGCFALPQGDPAISLFVWNRTDQTYVVRVGDDSSDECYLAAPRALGGFYHTMGSVDDGAGTRPLQLYSIDGRRLGPLRPTENAMIFVVEGDAALRAVTLAWKRGIPAGADRPIMDVPELPELDGRETPADLPITDEICTTD